MKDYDIGKAMKKRKWKDDTLYARLPHGTFNTADAAAILGVKTLWNVARALNGLYEAGMLGKSGGGRSFKWIKNGGETK